MPHEDRSTSDMRREAAQHVADAQDALARTDLGEMERQILQCQHMELYCSVMTQVAIIESDDRLLKTIGEQATKWATNMRAATTKRRNDIVPVLVEAVTEGASWADALRRLKDREQD